MRGVEYHAAQSNVLVMRPGNRLRELRKAAGLSQDELAEKTGVSQPAISQLENGTRSMDIQWMRTFARALGCAAADLLEDEDNPDRLDNGERVLVERYRHADRAQRQSIERVTAALVPDSDEGAAEVA